MSSDMTGMTNEYGTGLTVDSRSPWSSSAGWGQAGLRTCKDDARIHVKLKIASGEWTPDFRV